jgi:dTDP-4-dehydrorhamnose 3,5-epimerase
MIFTETKLKGAFVVDIEKHIDERGFFARIWCADEFATRGIDTTNAQFSVSFNKRRGTLRGMHWQVEPHAENKLVRCTRGGIYDVIVDLRADSPTYCQWVGVELTETNHRALFIPKMFAHGFITLEDNTEVFYQISERFAPESARGARYDDPAFGIDWHNKVQVIAQKDLAYPRFSK